MGYIPRDVFGQRHLDERFTVDNSGMTKIAPTYATEYPNECRGFVLADELGDAANASRVV